MGEKGRSRWRAPLDVSRREDEAKLTSLSRSTSSLTWKNRFWLLCQKTILLKRAKSRNREAELDRCLVDKIVYFTFYEPEFSFQHPCRAVTTTHKPSCGGPSASGLEQKSKKRQRGTEGSQKEGTTDMHFCDSGSLSVSMTNEATMAEGSKPEVALSSGVAWP